MVARRCAIVSRERRGSSPRGGGRGQAWGAASARGEAGGVRGAPPPDPPGAPTRPGETPPAQAGGAVPGPGARPPSPSQFLRWPLEGARDRGGRRVRFRARFLKGIFPEWPSWTPDFKPKRYYALREVKALCFHPAWSHHGT